MYIEKDQFQNVQVKAFLGGGGAEVMFKSLSLSSHAILMLYSLLLNQHPLVVLC